MLNGTYHLNNSGSRMVSYANGKKERFVLITPEGKQETRTALFYEMFGNFSTVCFSYKGKKIKAFFESFEQIDGMNVVRMKS
jgi:hypothetical protein